MPYCPGCGREVSEDDEFCPKCRTPLKEPRLRPVRRRDEKDEKEEKGEKHEGDQAGAILGGLVIMWLGVSFALRNMGFYPWADVGGVFLLGLGLILALRGVWAYSKTGVFDQGFGFVVGGGFVALLGAAITFNIDNLWPIFIIGLGAVIVLRAFVAQSRSPRP